MAEVAPISSHSSPTKQQPPNKITSTKFLAETPGLTTIPASYTFTPNSNDLVVSDTEEPVPVIDYSLLVSGNSEQRSKIVNKLGKACQDWGFFRVINHGVPERVIRSMIDGYRGFFDLSEEEKQEYQGNHVTAPIKYGTSFNPSVDKIFFWRDFLRVDVNPVFHSLTKPPGLSEAMKEYSKEVKEVARELLKGISESLGLEADYIEKEMNFEKGLHVNSANYYPPCTQPELAMGLPCHSDYGLLAFLTENGISGLQVQHKGKWVNLNSFPNSFVVNIGDQLEILSNGKYKSILHRAVVNEKATRMSIVVLHGPSLDAVVRPAKELLDRESKSPAYMGIKYGEYVESVRSNKLDGKSCLDRLRI